DPGDFGGKGVELIHHRIDGVLKVQDLPAHFDDDLLGEVSVGDRSGHLGEIGRVSCRVARHRVDVVGKILPGSGHSLDFGAASECAFGSYLSGDAGDFGRKSVDLIHHRIDGVLKVQDLALNVYGDLLGEVSVGDRSGHLG